MYMKMNWLKLADPVVTWRCVVSSDEVHSGDSGSSTKHPAHPGTENWLFFPTQLQEQFLETQGTATSTLLWPRWLSLWPRMCPVHSVYVAFLRYCRICGSVCLFVHVYCTQNVIANNKTISSDTRTVLSWDWDLAVGDQVQQILLAVSSLACRCCCFCIIHLKKIHFWRWLKIFLTAVIGSSFYRSSPSGVKSLLT